MKLYRRTEFMALPPGTLFLKGGQWYFSEFSVKGETRFGDFYARTLDGIDYSESGEMLDRYQAMLDQGASFPLDASECRDGCFDEEDLFLVFERDDLDELAKIVETARAVTPT